MNQALYARMNNKRKMKKKDNASKWPKFGTFDPNILRDLDNFIVRNGKWQEAPYLQSFFYLKS
jgi:hypothetical protein